VKTRQSAHQSIPKLFKSYFPAFLDLNGRRVVVIGGGKVAERKINSLLRAGALLTVISPEITKRIRKEKDAGRLAWVSRGYRKGDLKKALLVVAATDSLPVNERISRDAPCLVNVVDTPHLCNCIVPSVVDRKPLTIAISTSGVSPAFARTIRLELERQYGPEVSRFLKSVSRLRTEAQKTLTDKRKREKFLKAIASKEILGIIREKGAGAAKEVAKGRLDRAKKT